MRLVDDRRRVRPASSLSLCSGLSLLGFAAAAVALRGVLPPPRDDLAHRLAAFAARKDEYDAVIVGSSHVKTQISPALFDRVAQERGVAIRSCNLGVQGLDAIPLVYVVREIAALAPAKLAWVLIDPEIVILNVPERNVASARVVLWHDLATTCTVARAMWSSDLALGRKLTMFARDHLRPFSMNVTNLGLGRSWITHGSTAWTAEELAEIDGPLGDGFVSYEVIPGVENRAAELQRTGARYLKSPRYAQDLSWLPHTEDVDGPVDEPTSIVLGEIEAVVRGIGATPVFVLGPTLGDHATVVLTARAGVIRHLIAFNQPDRFPELYALENRLERSHLNAAGARIYTRLVAEAFVDIVESERRER